MAKTLQYPTALEFIYTKGSPIYLENIDQARVVMSIFPLAKSNELIGPFSEQEALKYLDKISGKSTSTKNSGKIIKFGRKTSKKK